MPKRGFAMPTEDISVRHIVVGGVLIAGTVALVVAVIFAVLRHADVPLAGPSRADYRIHEPAPALESAPQPDLHRSRAEKEKLLTTRGWVDEGAGIARIPIAAAMTLVSEGVRAAAPASAWQESSAAAAEAAASAARAARAARAAQAASAAASMPTGAAR